MNNIKKILTGIFLLMIIIVYVNSVLAQSQDNVTTSQNSFFSQSLEYLNHNSGAFNVIFSGLVAFSTIVYAFLTRSLVSEQEK